MLYKEGASLTSADPQNKEQIVTEDRENVPACENTPAYHSHGVNTQKVLLPCPRGPGI